MNKLKYPWALVLSGGGAIGFSHIGFLKKLEENGFPRPSLIAGTSMGAIVGGLYACGMSPAEMEDFILNEFKITDYLDRFVFKIEGPFGRIIQTGQALAVLAGRPGIDSGQKVLELFEKLTLGKQFRQTEIPFRCNAVDLISGNEVVFSEGSVAKAIRASMSLPVFFEPFHYNGMCFVDGGLLDNVPVAIARKEGFKRVLAINISGFTVSNVEKLKNGPQVIFRSIDCVLNSQEKRKTDKADLTLVISDDENLFSFFRQKELISVGEKTFKKNLSALNKFFMVKNE
jgi:NTE family protein